MPGQRPSPPAAASGADVVDDAVLPLLQQAQQHASLGLPVAPSERFRLAKRLVSRVCWPFLRHQVAFNEAAVATIRELSGTIARLDQRVRADVFEFADRSASQAQAEINDEIATARRAHADLLLELRTLQAELASMHETVTGDSGGTIEPA